MNKDSQHSSESGVKGFLENLPVLGRPILFIANLVGSSMSIARKLRSFFNSSHPSTLGGFVYIIAICSGITALLGLFSFKYSYFIRLTLSLIFEGKDFIVSSYTRNSRKICVIPAKLES